MSTLRGPADLLTAAGALVAVAVIGGAAALRWRDGGSRRVLFARGASPGAFGARASLEAVLPVFVGALAGLGLAVALTILVGPGAVARSAFTTAAWATFLVVPAAAALIGLISAVLFVLGSERRSRGSLRHVFVPWELLVLVAAAVFLYLLQTRGAFGEAEGDEVGRPSLAILLFHSSSSRALQASRRGLRRLFARFRGLGGSPASYLAAHRLASAGRLASLLAASTAVCLGTFVYAQAVARSLEETVEAKSLLRGQRRLRAHRLRPPDRQRLPAADDQGDEARRAQPARGRDRRRDGHRSGHLPSAAYFDESWAEKPLGDLVRLLESGSGDLPVIVTGRESDADTLTVRNVELPIEIAETVTAFPGMTRGRPLVVADRAAFERAVEDVGAPNPLVTLGAETYVWVKGRTQPTVNVLEASQLRPFPILTAERVRENPQIRSVSQTFSYLRALGLAAASSRWRAPSSISRRGTATASSRTRSRAAWD